MSVFATNGRGRGDNVSQLFYSNEDGEHIDYAVVISLAIPVPRAPEDVTVERLNETHMMVSWSALTPEEARGYLISYTVHYWPVSNTELVVTITTPPDTTRKVIGGLVSGEEYVVAVSATTGAGNGPRSSEISTVDTSQSGSSEATSFSIKCCL